MGYKLWKLSGESSTANHKTDIYAEILASRGFVPEAAETLADAPLSDPFLIKDMDMAVERIQQAIESGEIIAVYGDYDCDGVCATAILVSYLETTGAEVVPYIPSRESEGYGMNRQAVKKLVQEKGAGLIITVDNGINSIDEIAYAKELGADVVVTDHHQQKAVLPNAAAVVDAHRSDDKSPYKFMCGAGLAFKLVTAIEGCEYDEMLEYYGDIAALATVGDVVPLTGENRSLVRHGLKNIKETQNAGLAALIDVCGLADKPITAETAAFTLVPRINAAGRLGSADTALELLLTDDPERANELAEFINNENKRRQQIETEIVKTIADDIDKNPALVQQRVIVLSGRGWHHGVIGIVASRLVERYGKPCFLISVDGEQGVSSGRGVEGYSLFEALDECGELLVRYGGHAGAAGFTIETKNIDKFIKAINKYSARKYEYMPPNVLKADIECKPYDIRVSDIERLEVLEPFGCENEPVRYLFKNVRLKKITPIGAGKHLKLTLIKDSVEFTAVYFGVTAQSFNYAEGDSLNMIAACDINEYNGKTSVSIKVRDIRLADFNQELFFKTRELYERMLGRERIKLTNIDIIRPEREAAAAVYRLLREAKAPCIDREYLAERCGSNCAKVFCAIDALVEAGLVEEKIDKHRYTYKVVQGTAKADLFETRAFNRFAVSTGEVPAKR